MRIAAALLVFAAAALLLPFAFDWGAPYWTSVRPWGQAVLVVAPLGLILICVAAAWRTPAPSVWLRLLAAGAAALAAVALIATLVLEARFHWTRRDVLAADPMALERLGRHFIVGYRDLDEVRALIERRAIAGVYLSAHNVRGLAPAEIKQQIAALQDIRRAQNLPPLWIATDQEGGAVSRLSPPLSRLPTLGEIIATHPDWTERLDAVRQFARQQGRELAGVGVNLNFAPVVDVDHGLVNPDDRYSHIHERAISTDPEIVAEVAHVYCEALAAEHVRCTLKHFPGLGRVFEDTHSGAARLNASLSELETSDWLPFRAVGKDADALTMLSHVRLTALDPDHPASASAAVIAGALRRAWDKDGVLITDDFSMGAIYRSREGVAGASVEALNAGADLILISFDPDQYYVAMGALLDADAHGRLSREALAQSERRLTAAPFDGRDPAARPADGSR